ncbi:hypothetical protein AJ88_04275 [Mesorhizobium amorphae CCBAU 01583]|nr:hypothetical protein AJ88_04275 [Mesorhizobium amorphae CCBAU 01583]
MIKIKYFAAILAAQQSQRPVSEMPPFDLGRLRSKGGLASRIGGYLFSDPRWILTLRAASGPISHSAIPAGDQECRRSRHP